MIPKCQSDACLALPTSGRLAFGLESCVLLYRISLDWYCPRRARVWGRGGSVRSWTWQDSATLLLTKIPSWRKARPPLPQGPPGFHFWDFLQLQSLEIAQMPRWAPSPAPSHTTRYRGQRVLSSGHLREETKQTLRSHVVASGPGWSISVCYREVGSPVLCGGWKLISFWGKIWPLLMKLLQMCVT